MFSTASTSAKVKVKVCLFEMKQKIFFELMPYGTFHDKSDTLNFFLLVQWV